MLICSMIRMSIWKLAVCFFMSCSAPAQFSAVFVIWGQSRIFGIICPTKNFCPFTHTHKHTGGHTDFFYFHIDIRFLILRHRNRCRKQDKFRLEYPTNVHKYAHNFIFKCSYPCWIANNTLYVLLCVVQHIKKSLARLLKLRMLYTSEVIREHRSL